MRPDEFYLRDIIIACLTAKGYVSSIDKERFERSEIIQHAVLFNLMIIGESASQITASLKSRHPNVDWQSLKGFRNIITHEYFSLNLNIVWDSAHNDSLVLMRDVRLILKEEYPNFPLPSGDY